MISPKKGSRQAMKQPRMMQADRQTRRTIVFLKHHTGARMLPNWLSKLSKMGWQYTCTQTRRPECLANLTKIPMNVHNFATV